MKKNTYVIHEWSHEGLREVARYDALQMEFLPHTAIVKFHNGHHDLVAYHHIAPNQTVIKLDE
jgi:hypothetical protein